MDKIVFFWGSDQGFRECLESYQVDLDLAMQFPEIISQYNETIRASNQGFINEESRYFTDLKNDVEDVIIKQSDFSSVLEHVLLNFTQIISLAHNIENIYIQNPPRRVIKSLKSAFNEELFLEVNSEYKQFHINELKQLQKHLDKTVFGQKNTKFSVLSSMYQLSKKHDKKPIVLHFYGPSGVGKTELARAISLYFGGNLLKIQFSMMQTDEAVKYIFGDAHNKASFAGDLLSRESNIVLIDEFDKVHPNFYNAFYEVFDEGFYRDLNYSVNLENTVFILTSNFSSDDELEKRVGPAIASRIGKSIRFEYLDEESIRKIITKHYEDVTNELDEEEMQIIENSKLLSWYLDKALAFKNIRIAKSNVEQDVFDLLTENKLIN
ncbi:AAA domain-containing protein [Acetobacterium malicum]|uniref:AAA domain-containing protein n=1 Tax=Acetobacterium malicum TaxID=52692 RepID=A0ABR6Z2B4_9FIRM|nr:AAA family ATPase [Acetobacterium malicum]MBC3901673.1 AAA domain-containing protein [Acetobacterium malicum]